MWVNDRFNYSRTNQVQLCRSHYSLALHFRTDRSTFHPIAEEHRPDQRQRDDNKSQRLDPNSFESRKNPTSNEKENEGATSNNSCNIRVAGHHGLQVGPIPVRIPLILLIPLKQLLKKDVGFFVTLRSSKIDRLQESQALLIHRVPLGSPFQFRQVCFHFREHTQRFGILAGLPQWVSPTNS